MSALWLIPLGVIVVGLIPSVVAGMRAAEEAALLRRELNALGQLRPALVDINRDVAALRESALRAAERRQRVLER